MEFVKYVRAAVVGAALVVAPVAANAASVSFTGLSVADLDALTPVTSISPTSTTGVYFDNVTGNQFSGSTLISRSPWEDSIHEATGEFSSVQGGATATFTFATAQTALNLIWGSPDSYNDITITLLGGGGVDVINGTEVQGPTGILASSVEITDVLFTTVVFDSGSSNAFEFANLTTTPVPLPAGMLLMGTALAGFAVMRRRKSKAA